MKKVILLIVLVGTMSYTFQSCASAPKTKTEKVAKPEPKPGDRVYVEGYTRRDGVTVPGKWKTIK